MGPAPPSEGAGLFFRVRRSQGQELVVVCQGSQISSAVRSNTPTGCRPCVLSPGGSRYVQTKFLDDVISDCGYPWVI
jgi:hypothetical protein